MDKETSSEDGGRSPVPTEFFCVEARADKGTKDRYKEISDVVGYDIHKFYMENSPQHGYKRLHDGLKRPILTRMKEEANKLGLKFHASDSCGRDLNTDGINCCGVPDEWNSVKSHFGGAILTAKKNGTVTFSDIADEVFELFGGFKWVKAAAFNTGNNRARMMMGDATMADYIRYVWNSPRLGKSPAKMYGGILLPIGRDGSGDVIYENVPPTPR